eukprot:g54355.t1
MAQAEEIRTETGPLDYDYTEKEVELCQENLQNHKACSPDKIKNEMLKPKMTGGSVHGSTSSIEHPDFTGLWYVGVMMTSAASIAGLLGKLGLKITHNLDVELRRLQTTPPPLLDKLFPDDQASSLPSSLTDGPSRKSSSPSSNSPSSTVSSASTLSLGSASAISLCDSSLDSLDGTPSSPHKEQQAHNNFTSLLLEKDSESSTLKHSVDLTRLKFKKNLVFVASLLSVIVLNPVLDLLAYGYAAQSLLVPFTAQSIMWNTLLSPYVLKEHLTCRDWAGTLLILLGCTLTAVSGNKETQSYNEAQVLAHFDDPVFLGYFGAMIALVLMLGYIIAFRQGPARKFACGVVGGVVGGNLYFVKSSSLLMNFGEGVWHELGTYIIIAATIVVPSSGLFLVNFALQRYPGVHVIPLYESSLIITGSVSAATWGKDWSHFEPWQYVVFPLGLICIVSGIPLIVDKEHKTHTELLQEDEVLEKELSFSEPSPKCSTVTSPILEEASPDSPRRDPETPPSAKNKKSAIRQTSATLAGSLNASYQAGSPPDSVVSSMGHAPLHNHPARPANRSRMTLEMEMGDQDARRGRSKK